MTRLVVDIGNSRMKWAIAHGGGLITPAQAHAHDEVEAVLAAWQAMPEPPTTVYLASVTEKPVVAALTAWIDQHWQIPVSMISTPAEGGGIRVAYPDRTQLGPDRWLAMVGARINGLLPACIVDCGSAITLDAVDADGGHHGGLILAGLAAQRAGLAAIAPALPDADLDQRVPLLACNTPDAMAAGHLRVTAAAIEQLTSRMSEALGFGVPVVLTGGDATRIQSYLRQSVGPFPDLVLEGLAALD